MPFINSVRSSFGPQSSFTTVAGNIVEISSSASLSNFQVMVDIPYRPFMRSDFADLKFLQGTTTCSYWIEQKTNGVTARVWIKVPTVSNGTTVLKVSADGTTNNSSGVNTFEWFDDFSSGSYGSGKWNLNNTSGFSVTSSGLPSGVNHGSFCLFGNNTNGNIWGSTTWNGNFEVHERSYSSSTAPNGFTRNGFSQGYSSSINGNYLDHDVDSVYLRADNSWYGGSSFATNSTPTGGAIRNNWNRSYIKLYNNTATLVVTDSTGKAISVGPETSSVSSGMQGPRLGTRGDLSYTSQSYSCYWDWFFIKKSANVQPIAIYK